MKCTASGGTAAHGPHAASATSVHISGDLFGPTSLHSQPQQTSIATSKKLLVGRSFIFTPHHLLFDTWSRIVLKVKQGLTSTFVCNPLFLKYIVEHKLYVSFSVSGAIF